MTYIEELIKAIKIEDKLEFHAAVKEHSSKYPPNLPGHPFSAYMLDGNKKVLYLNFDIDSQDLTESMVEKIAPHLKESGIISVGFRGGDAALTPAMKRLHSIINENTEMLENANTGKKPKI